MADVSSDKRISSEVPFHVFSVLCEKISKTQGKEKKKSLLHKFIGYWRTSHQKTHGQHKTVSFFTSIDI